MAVILQFVDSIAANPTVRLDLNGGAVSLQAEGTDFGFPDLERAVVSTLLADGGSVPASAYGLRTLTLRLLVSDTDANAVATQMQSLFRELERAKNILKYQPHTSSPVFFKTLRSGPESAQIITSGSQQVVVVQILAEPFALGLLETLSQVTVNNDPASANGRYWDITGIKGDVETPPLLQFSSADVLTKQSALAIRRRGTPSNAPFLLQAESMTMGTDTTTQANSATYSGSSNNYTSTTFATNSAMAERLFLNPFPAAASVDNRGTYRVFARCTLSTTGTCSLRMKYGGTSSLVTGGTVTTSAVTVRMLDLGLMSIPVTQDPVYNDAGVEISARGLYFALEASRSSGSANLFIDLVLFVPADDRLALIQWISNTSGTATKQNAQVSSGSIYPTEASGAILSGTSSWYAGRLPELSPGVTNRLYFLHQVDPTIADTITGSTTVDVSYHPRYLYVRPVSS